MSFIQVSNVGDAVEATAVDEAKYDLTVAFVSDDDSKAGKPMITLGLEIDGHPDAAMVYHYISLPHEDDEEKAGKFKLLMVARTFAMLGFDIAEGIETEDLYGATFNAFLSKEEIEDENADPDEPPQFRNILHVPKLAA